MAEVDVKRFVEVSRLIHKHEVKNTRKNLQLKKRQLQDLSQTVTQLAEHYSKVTAKVAKEKADVDKMKEPSTRDFFNNQTSFDEKMSVETEEYLEAVTEQEIAKKQLDGVIQQKKQLEQESKQAEKDMETLLRLYNEQDAILGHIFHGEYGSALENQLEAESDALLERKEIIMAAKYKWSNAKILLQHAVQQLGVACMKWTSLPQIYVRNVQAKYTMATEARNNLIAANQNISSAQRYLNNIIFPYCEPAEMETLNRACQNVYIDMQSAERHQHAYQCFSVTYRRAAALLQWFDSVISNTIDKDLEMAKKELAPKERALRWERLQLMKEKLGDEADDFNLAETDFSADEDGPDPELNALIEPEKADCGNNLAADDSPPKAPSPLPLSQLAPPPSQEELFGNIEQLRQRHEIEMAEFEKAQETNRARQKQGLQEKLAARRNRPARMSTE